MYQKLFEWINSVLPVQQQQRERMHPTLLEWVDSLLTVCHSLIKFYIYSIMFGFSLVKDLYCVKLLSWSAFFHILQLLLFVVIFYFICVFLNTGFLLFLDGLWIVVLVSAVEALFCNSINLFVLCLILFAVFVLKRFINNWQTNASQ